MNSDKRMLENRMRKGSLKKDEKTENILGIMNEELKKNHNRLILASEAVNSFPFLFVCGLPRSGTTLLMQLLSNCLDVGYINNLIARFWSAPLYGIVLSRTLLSTEKEKAQDYTSSWGKTRNIDGPHEFSYFWHEWFHPHDCPAEMGIDLEKIHLTTDWQELRNILCNMAHYFNKPVLFKGIWPAYFLKKFVELLPRSLFIFISRKDEDVAMSLYRTRLKYYENPNTWWSVYPAEYNRLKDLPWYEQIAGQIFYLNQLYSRQIEKINRRNILFVDYKTLCDSPPKVLETIRTRLEENFSYTVDLIRKPPDHFRISGYDGKNNTAEYELLQSALKIFKEKDIVNG
jgi:hypothetical protein